MKSRYRRRRKSLEDTTSPDTVLEILYQQDKFNLDSLRGKNSCSDVEHEKFKVYEMGNIIYLKKEGLNVVVKRFTIENVELVDEVYVMSDSLCEMVVSSYLHEESRAILNHCFLFPYIEGFMTCGDKGYAVMEKIDLTFKDFIGKDMFNGNTFRSILFQSITACMFMAKHKINHNDLHISNVMIRYTPETKLRGMSLDDVEYFSIQIGKKTYYLRNRGVLVRIIDYGHSAKHSEKKVIPTKIYAESFPDNWNIKNRFAKSYDILTMLGYTTYYMFIDPKYANVQIEQKRVLLSLLDYIVEVAEREVGPIKFIEGASRSKIIKEIDSNNSLVKFLTMLHLPTYRPREKYVNLDLSGILDIPAFKRYSHRREYSYSLAIF